MSQNRNNIDPLSVASAATAIPRPGGGWVGAGERVAARAGNFLSRAGGAITSRLPAAARLSPALGAVGRGVTRYAGPIAAVGMAGLDAYNNRDNPNYDVGGQLTGNALGYGLGLLSAPITGPFAPLVGAGLSAVLGNVGSRVNLIPDSPDVKVARANQELSNRLQNISDPVIAKEVVEQNRNQLRQDLNLPTSASTGFDFDSTNVGDNLTDLPGSVEDYRAWGPDQMFHEIYDPSSRTFQGRRMLQQMELGDTRLLNRDMHQMGMQKLGAELQAQQAANALQGYLADTDSYRNFLGGFVNRINY